MAVDYVKRSATAYYQTQALITRQTVQSIGAFADRITAADIDGSWQAVRQSVAQSLSAGQARAASTASLITDRVLAADGLTPQPMESLSPLAFAGRTADGVDVQTVLDSTTTYAKLGIARGTSPEDALAAARRRLQKISGSEVQDAGRGAVEAQMLLDPQFTGYERLVNLPCCSRCLVLAGKFYSRSAGFLRHPNCDCTHIPVTSRDGKPIQDSRDLFHELTDAQQDAIFTPDGARAIRDGASISQVVNARWQGGVRGKSAGMSRPGDPYTTSGTTKRSAYYRQQKAAGNTTARGKLTVRRLSPQGVALQAGGDTVLYRQLLRDNGYL